MAKLGRMRVAAIVADGFEQVELDEPVAALRREGVAVDVLAPDAKHHDHIVGVRAGVRHAEDRLHELRVAAAEPEHEPRPEPRREVRAPASDRRRVVHPYIQDPGGERHPPGGRTARRDRRA